MVQGRKREPNTKAFSNELNLNDPDIELFKKKLASVKVKDFKLKEKFDGAEKTLDSNDKKKLKLCKLLYCIGYKKEMFLQLGIIIESRLNSIVDLYITNKWQTPLNYNSNSIAFKLEEFQKKKALGEKADLINHYNLFNNSDTSEQLKHQIQGFRFLRNYGGHSKSVNEFLDTVIESEPDCNNEIEAAIKLIMNINVAIKILIKNPPLNV